LRLMKWVSRNIDTYNNKSLARLATRLGPTAKEIVQYAALKNNGIVIAENLYNHPSVKSSFYSVLTGDQGHIDHRDPKKMAEIAEALSTLEQEGLIWSPDQGREIFKVTIKGKRFATGARFPTSKDVVYMILISVWIAIVAVGSIILFR
jgi:hypothetical protein